MLKAFGRSTSGIHARPRKMVRFCCSVKPSQLWWGLPHPHHQLDFPHYPSKTTNTLASLVKGEVLSPEKIRATTGGIASPPSLRTTFLPPLVKGEVLSPKKFGRLPEGLSHLPYPFRFSDTSVNNLSFRTQPFQIRTIPRKSPTPLPCFAPSPLPPLEKGEVA